MAFFQKLRKNVDSFETESVTWNIEIGSRCHGMIIPYVPVNRTVGLTGTSLLNLLTGLPVVQISNFVYSVPVNQTLVNRTVRITGNPICPVNEESG